MEPRPKTPPLQRLAALAVATLGMAALRTQFDALQDAPGLGALQDRLWRMAAFFTILTNALVTVHMLAVALHWRIGAARAAGLLLSIAAVGIVYHLILARLWNPQGLAWWADLGMHTGMPLAYGLWWLLLAPKGVVARDLPGWLIWPAAYCAYALTRGALTGFWPYPFLDADALGWPQVALNLAGMLAAFALGGWAILTLARRVSRRDQRVGTGTSPR